MLLLLFFFCLWVPLNIAWLSCFVCSFGPCKHGCCVLYIVNVKIRDLKTLWSFTFLGVHFKYNNGLILATIVQILLRIVSNCISGNLGKWHHEEEVMLLFVPVWSCVSRSSECRSRQKYDQRFYMSPASHSLFLSAGKTVSWKYSTNWHSYTMLGISNKQAHSEII